MNAKGSLKALMAQAEIDYGLVGGTSEHERVLNVVAGKSEIELAVAEEVKDIFAAKNDSGNIYLGLRDGTGDVAESVEWAIKTNFVDELRANEILLSVKRDDLLDEVSESWLSVLVVETNDTHEEYLQKVINELAREVKDSGRVVLIKDELEYKASTCTLSFGQQSIDFSNLSRHHYMLDFLFNEIKQYQFVDSDTLYEYVFEKELPIKIKDDGKNNARNQEVKRLGNVRDEINQKVKDGFNTGSQLIFSRGSYKRNF